MEKGIIYFAHNGGGELYEYFKTVFLHQLEAFCNSYQLLFGIDGPNKFDELLVEGAAPSEKMLAVTCACTHPYLHPLLDGFAQHFSVTVDDTVCKYQKLDD